MNARNLVGATLTAAAWNVAAFGVAQVLIPYQESGAALPPKARMRLGDYRSHVPQGATLAPSGQHYALVENDWLVVGDVATGDRRRLAVGSDLAANLTFSPDSRFVVINGKKRGDVRLVDLQSGKIIKQAVVPTPKDKTAATVETIFSSDGRHIAVAWTENTQAWVWVWQPATGEFRGPFKTVYHQNDGNRIRIFLAGRGEWQGNAEPSFLVFALSTDGQTLALLGKTPDDKGGSFRHLLQLWDVASAKKRCVITTAHPIQTVAFAPDGKTIAVASGEHTYRLYETMAGREHRTLLSQPRTVRESGTPIRGDPRDFYAYSFHDGQKSGDRLHFSADGKILAAARGSSVQQWETATGKRRGALESPAETITALAFRPVGLTVRGHTRQSYVTWNTDSPEAAPPVAGLDRVYWLAFTPRGDLLAREGSMNNGLLRRWDSKTGRLLASEKNSFANASGTLSSDGKYLLEGGANYVVYETATRQALFTLEGRNALVAWQPGSHRLAWFHDKVLRIYAVDDGDEVSRQVINVPLEKNETMGWQAMELAPGGKIAVFVVNVSLGDMNARELIFYDLAANKSFARPRFKFSDFQHLISPDGALTLFADPSGISLFKTSTGKLWRHISHSDSATLTNWQFAPDGRTLAASQPVQGGVVSAVLIWEIATGQLRHRLQGHRAPINCLAYSPDSRTLATGSQDTTILLWDVGVTSAVAKQPIKIADLFLRLASPAADQALGAMNLLAAIPAEALALCKQVLPPAPPFNLEEGEISRLITDLDHPLYAVRVKTTKALTDAGLDVERHMVKALERPISLEQQYRLERLIDSLATRRPKGVELLAIRAVELVEALATPEARALLAAWAGGAPNAFLTQHARAAMARAARK